MNRHSETESPAWIDKYKKTMVNLFTAIKSGDAVSAKEALNTHLAHTKSFLPKNIEEFKAELEIYNMLCHICALDTCAEPKYTIVIYTNIERLIKKSKQIDKYAEIVEDITSTYCKFINSYKDNLYSPIIKKVIYYIESRLDEKISLSTVAEHFNKTATTLSSRFSKEVGMPMSIYIQKQRVQEAKRLFSTTELSVSEVALSVGYSDFAYFSKVFKKHAGISPNTYRKEASGNLQGIF